MWIFILSFGDVVIGMHGRILLDRMILTIIYGIICIRLCLLLSVFTMGQEELQWAINLSNWNWSNWVNWHSYQRVSIIMIFLMIKLWCWFFSLLCWEVMFTLGMTSFVVSITLLIARKLYFALWFVLMEVYLMVISTFFVMCGRWWFILPHVLGSW